MRAGVRRWVRGHPRVVDAAVAGLVFAYHLPIQAASVPPGLPSGTGVLLGLGLCAPYLVRRDRPVTCAAVVVAVFTVQAAVGVLFVPADVMTLFAVYAVAVARGRTTSLPVTGLVAALWVLAALRWDDPFFAVSEVVTAVVATASVWAWGHTVGVRRAHVAQLVRERDAQDRIAVAAERARLAREMHDVVAHGLSVVVVMAQGAASAVRTDPDRAEQAMRTVERTGRTALDEMRRMLDVLRDNGTAPGVEQVRGLVADARDAGLPVELTVHGVPRALPAEVGAAAYRIVQEALTNVRRHAGPSVTRVLVDLRVDDDRLAVLVEDDGRGGPSLGGNGLTGMRERVTARGGELDAGPRDGGGFRVRAAMPSGTAR